MDVNDWLITGVNTISIYLFKATTPKSVKLTGLKVVFVIENEPFTVALVWISMLVSASWVALIIVVSFTIAINESFVNPPHVSFING